MASTLNLLDPIPFRFLWLPVSHLKVFSELTGDGCLAAAHCCDSPADIPGVWAPNLTTPRGQAIKTPPVAVLGTECSNDKGKQSQKITNVVVHPKWDK